MVLQTDQSTECLKTCQKLPNDSLASLHLYTQALSRLLTSRYDVDVNVKNLEGKIARDIL